VVPVTALLLLFLVTGLRGIDFGYHYDEIDWHLRPARDMVANGVLLPRSYIYPSVDKWLFLVPAVPAAVAAAVRSHGEPKAVQAAAVAAMDARGYLLQVRGVFLLLSTLGILWVYLMALVMRFPWWQALIAAAGLGLSWELAYHARFAVSDCILVQFSALTMLLLALHHRTGKLGWLFGAAVTAGLGLGAKYTGLFLLGSVLLAGAWSESLLPLRRHLGAQARRALLIGAITFACYLVTTPATLLDPVEFAIQTRDVSIYYSRTHWGYTATSGWNHGWIFLSYLSLSYFSPFLVPAAAAFLITILGGVFFVRDDRRLAAVIMLCPFLFITAFCIKYRVAVVRNTLYLTPILGLLLARGVAEIGRRVKPLWARRALAGALAAAMLAQAIWLIGAAEGIRHVSMQSQVQSVLEYIARHPKDKYRVSSQIHAIAVTSKVTIPANATILRGSDAKHVVFFARGEGPSPFVWKVNDRWLTEATFGPREMNFNWYSTWSGHDRIVVMAIDKARSFGVDLAK
jgi:hypothetical protein